MEPGNFLFIIWTVVGFTLNAQELPGKEEILQKITQANEALHPDGMLGYVQSTGKEPKEGQPVTFDKIPDFEDFGLGCFLLAGSEVYLMR